jgi:hypothetical protein
VHSFVFGGQHYDEITTVLGGPHFGGNFEVNFLGRAVREACSATWIVVTH